MNRVLVTLLLLNIVSGIIIDSFAQLRDQKAAVERAMAGKCFVCGIESGVFDRYGKGFENHTSYDHYMWNYLFFVHHLKNKPSQEYTGQESFVSEKLSQQDFTWIPVGRARVLEQKKEDMSAEMATENI